MSNVMEQCKGQRDKARYVGAQQCIYVINGNQIAAKIYVKRQQQFSSSVSLGWTYVLF